MVPSEMRRLTCKQCGAQYPQHKGVRVEGVTIQGPYKAISFDGDFHTVECFIAWTEGAAHRAGIENLSNMD